MLVASSQAVYSEGAAICPEHGLVFPAVRPVDATCSRAIGRCTARFAARSRTSAPTPEEAPVGGETVYGLTKVDQEKLVLLWGKQIGIPTVALRYSCTYGPRQSIFNPYTGVIAIFCTRLLNDLPPVLYEDGEQTRDFSFVEDIARANLLAAETDQARWPAGECRERPRRPDSRSGRADFRRPEDSHRARNEWRVSPGEMRHLNSGTERIRAAGYEPQVDLANGIERYLGWIRQQQDVREYFSEAAAILRDKGIVHRVRRS